MRCILASPPLKEDLKWGESQYLHYQTTRYLCQTYLSGFFGILRGSKPLGLNRDGQIRKQYREWVTHFDDSSTRLQVISSTEMVLCMDESRRRLKAQVFCWDQLFVLSNCDEKAQPGSGLFLWRIGIHFPVSMLYTLQVCRKVMLKNDGLFSNFIHVQIPCSNGQNLV